MKGCEAEIKEGLDAHAAAARKAVSLERALDALDLALDGGAEAVAFLLAWQVLRVLPVDLRRGRARDAHGAPIALKAALRGEGAVLAERSALVVERTAPCVLLAAPVLSDATGDEPGR